MAKRIDVRFADIVSIKMVRRTAKFESAFDGFGYQFASQRSNTAIVFGKVHLPKPTIRLDPATPA